MPGNGINYGYLLRGYAYSPHQFQGIVVCPSCGAEAGHGDSGDVFPGQVEQIECLDGNQ